MLKREIEKEVKIPNAYKYISAFLTMRCNLNCSFCLNTLDKNKEFNRNKFKEISGEEWIKGLNRIESRPEVPITFSGGEPMMHPDFIYIINNLKPELNINILTNLSYNKGLEKCIKEINPERIKGNALYPSIRVSYHPEQMGDGKKLLKNTKKLQDLGFSIGIYYVAYPAPKDSELITQMQFMCLDTEIDFRRKDFTGKFEGLDDYKRPFSITYGNYSKYPDSVFQKETKSCLCRTSELLIGPNGDVYKCHKDLFSEEFPIGNIKDSDFQVRYEYRKCNKYGNCHPCDVKIKTNYKQKLDHTSVEIKN